MIQYLKIVRLEQKPPSTRTEGVELERKGLGLGRNPPFVPNIVTERGKNKNDLFPYFELDGKIICKMGKK